MNIFQQIGALFKIRSVGKEIIKEARMPNASGKPGWKTTEFWMNLVGQIGVVWGVVHGFIPQPWGEILSISGIAVYTVARTVAKAVGDVQAARTRPVPAA